MHFVEKSSAKNCWLKLHKLGLLITSAFSAVGSGAEHTVGTSHNPTLMICFASSSPAFFVVIVCDAVVADEGRIPQRNAVTDI